MGAKIGFFNFLCCKFILWKFSLFMFAKHYKIGVSASCCVLLFTEKKKVLEKMITGISGFGFFLSKNGRFVTRISLSKNALLKPHISIVFWGCALFGPSCQKRETLDTHPRKKTLTDNWKAHFWVFFWFFLFFVLFLVFFFFLFFWRV